MGTIFLFLVASFPSGNLVNDYQIYDHNWVAIQRLPDSPERYLIQGKYDNKLLIVDGNGKILHTAGGDLNLLDEPVVLGIFDKAILVVNKNGNVVSFGFDLKLLPTEYSKFTPVPRPMSSVYIGGGKFAVLSSQNVTTVALEGKRWKALGTRYPLEFAGNLPAFYVTLQDDLAFKKIRPMPGDDAYHAEVYNQNGELVNVLTRNLPDLGHGERLFVLVALQMSSGYVVQNLITNNQYQRLRSWLDVFATNGDSIAVNIEVLPAYFLQAVGNSDLLYFLNEDTDDLIPANDYIASRL